jgi:exonuclease-1
MGIQGLLKGLHPLLVPPPSHPSQQHQGVGVNNNNKRSGNNAVVRHNIRQFAGKSLAIDASSWLHKAAYSCAERLVESIESNIRDPIAEKAYTNYILSRCNELLVNAQIQTIYLVFDGIRIPLKAHTNANRSNKRTANLQAARQYKARGMNKEATEKYLQCVKATDFMARVVSAAVMKQYGSSNNKSSNAPARRVQCIWSPYEADAQLVKLCIDGYAHAIVTEDSDVLVYTAVARLTIPIIYKLDRNDGCCDVITMDWLLNPTFLSFTTTSTNAAGNNGGGAGSRRRESRRQERKRRREENLEYIYKDNPSLSLSDETAEETNNDDDNNDAAADDDGVKVASGGEVVHHACEVEYFDMGFAPIRRTLMSPPTAATAMTTTLTKGGRKRKSDETTTTTTAAAGMALLSILRSFATKEKFEPGAGVRLFVQSCVLSGCDYVINRLSKVGPVTAFRLVKEVSHRDPSDRFERIIKFGLPTGSHLIAEEKVHEDSENNEDENNNNNMDDNDFLSQGLPDTDRNAKEKYVKLLVQSEAVFYYHLSKELSTGNIVPLVSYNKSSSSSSATGRESAERLRPCIDNFDEGLLFIGSVTEVSKTVPEPPPSIDTTTTSRGRGLQQKNNNNGGGWMSTKVNTLMSTTNASSSRPRFGGGNVHVQPRQNSATIATLSKEVPKETPMQKYLKGNNKTVKSVKHSIYPSKNNAIKETTMSFGCDGSKIDNAIDSAAIGNSRKRYIGSIAVTANTVPMVQQPNPFTAYTYASTSNDKTEETKVRFDTTTFTHKEIELSAEKEREKESSTSKRVVTDKTTVMMKSPFFSSPAPTNFDYGGFTPLVERDIAIKNVPGQSFDNDDSSSKTREKVSTLSRRSDDCLTAALSQQQQLLLQYTNANDKAVTRKNDTSFDYGIIMESPRRSPRRKHSPNSSGVLRSYIDQTLNSTDVDKQGPRRVSKSPPEGLRKDLFHEGSSPEDVIDLIDDDDASIPNVSSPVKENYPNCEQQRNDKVGSMNVATSSSSSSVTMQKFKIPYPKATKKRLTASSHTSHNNADNKTRATISSSALLAGFARQKEICPASRSSGTKSKFFPIKSMANSNSTKNLKNWFAPPSIEKEGGENNRIESKYPRFLD